MRKVTAVFLIIAATILAFAAVHMAQLALSQLTHVSDLSSYGWGQTSGRAFAVFLFGLLAVRSFRAGLLRFVRPAVATPNV